MRHCTPGDATVVEAVLKPDQAAARRQAEAASQESELFARSTLDSLSAHIAILDQSGVIVAVNRAWRRFAEENPQLNGQVCEGANYLKTCESVKDGDMATARAFAEGIRSVLEGRRSEFSLEYACHSPGQQRWFVGRVTRLVDDNQLRVVVAHENITERRLAEAQVHQLNTELDQRVRERTAQLEVTNQELEAFSYSVSHDLRAPLRAVTGFARILATDHARELDHEGHRLLGVLSAEAERMGELINDLLAFSRLGRQPINRTEFDLEALVREAFAQLAGPDPARKLRFSMSGLARVCGDAHMIRQVLLNLLSNALKFTGTRKVPEIEFGSRGENGETIYYVRDNGVGFDMKYATKLFGAFQRLHSNDTFEGTGVGLSIVQRIIHRHGGRIWAMAKLDEGATFYFTLPHE